MTNVWNFLVDKIGLPPIIVVVCIAIIGFFTFRDTVLSNTRDIASLEERTVCVEKFVAAQTEYNKRLEECHKETQRKLENLEIISQNNVDRIISQTGMIMEALTRGRR